MCGISGTVFNYQKIKSKHQSYNYLLLKLDKIDKFSSNKKLNDIYDLVWEYKNDDNFLLFFKSKQERAMLKK